MEVMMDKRYASNSSGRGQTRKRKRRVAKRFLIFVIALLSLLIAAILLIMAPGKTQRPGETARQQSAALPKMTTGPDGQIIEVTPTPEPTPSPSPTPPPPMAVASTEPSEQGIRQDYNLNGRNVDSFSREEPIMFGSGDEYTDLPGVITFRGNNYRDTGSYGAAKVEQKKLEIVWEVETAAIRKGSGSGYWTGAGWTGQPILVQWPESTRRAMNIRDEKKSQDGLVEVIYAIEDGRVYFLDLKDGKKTRDTLRMGITFKGSGGIDPRGVPLLYVGAGDSTPSGDGYKAKQPGFYVVNLLNCETIYEFGTKPDDFAPRYDNWHAYDAAAIVDADTDTLIVPGENGVIYSMKLNTKYDEAAGTLTIDPSEKLKMRYTTSRAREGQKKSYWLGVETSPVYYRDHMYFADNAGTLICLNLNTMQVVWAADVKDDTNSTPVLEIENGHPYIYISTSLHWTADKNNQGTIPIWKFDALTGEVVWQKDYECATVSGVSGGVQSTALVGKGPLSDTVFFSVARTPSTSTGILVALDKATGKVKWEYKLKSYPWSSPVAVYSEDNKGYIVQCSGTEGKVFLIDGETGEQLDEIQLVEATIEATPAVFNDMIVVGSRGQRIYGIKIK